MPIAVIPVEDRHIAAMATIRAQEWETEAFWKDRIGRYLRAEHSPHQALPPRAAFVAVDDGTVVGFVSGHRTRRYKCEGELQWINVIEERRGQGVAGKLLVTMAAWFVRQDALRVCVNADPNNTAARAFYLKYGAQPLHDYWMIWEDVGQIGRQSNKIDR